VRVCTICHAILSAANTASSALDLCVMCHAMLHDEEADNEVCDLSERESR
jgi:hypothetical protein